MESSWNYETDLELIKQKLPMCSSSAKHKIQRSIAKILEEQFPDFDDVEPLRDSTSTSEDYSEDTQRTLQSVDLTSACLDLDQSSIQNVIRLMHQFKKDFQGTSKLLEDSEIENSVARKLFQTTSLTELENLWNVFRVYLKKTVETKEPKCPLEVDLVLEKVFGYLSTKDLLNCRLVSRTWNEKLMRWEFPKRNECAVTLSLDKKSQIIESNVTSPFIFSKLNFDPTCLTVEECKSFFTTFGPFVKTLKLFEEDLDDLKKTEDNKSRSSSLFEVIHNLRSIFQNVNQMEKLEITDLPKSVLEQPFIFTQEELRTVDLPKVRYLELRLTSDFSKPFSEGFFSMLHNVKSLCLRSDISTNNYEQLLGGIQKLKLTYLNLECHKNLLRNVWTSLQSQNLEILQTDLYFESDEDVASFEKFIQSQSQTLKSFTLDGSSVMPNRVIRKAQLPIMQNLETLTFSPRNSHLLVPIKPQQVPKLQSASFNFCKTSKYFASRDFTTVRQLISNRDLEEFDAADWSSLRSRFPNVKSLYVYISYGIHGNADAASELFLGFPNLEYLDLLATVRDYSETTINRLLSGFSTEGDYVLSQWLDTLNSPEELPIIEPVRGSLRDMKKLKELQLSLDVPLSDGDEEQVEINSVGVQLGLMRIQPLEQLSIFGDFTISEEGAALLKNYHRSVIISPSAPFDE